MEETIKIQLVNQNAQIPKRQTQNAAGLDLCSCHEYIVQKKNKKLISTGIKIQIPIGYYGRIAPRSGLACKNFIDVGAGVIDSDYRGEVKVLLFNFSEDDFQVQIGDRIAQLIIEKINISQPEIIQNLDDTDRGSDGFGSTGTK